MLFAESAAEAVTEAPGIGTLPDFTVPWMTPTLAGFSWPDARTLLYVNSRQTISDPLAPLMSGSKPLCRFLNLGNTTDICKDHIPTCPERSVKFCLQLPTQVIEMS